MLSPERTSLDMKGVTRLGVIPFGRAAGMAELGVGTVLIGGRPSRLLGPPSLQHTRVDLSRHPRASVGDEVVIVGRQGRSSVTVEDVLRAHPETPDSATALQVREAVPRVYINRRRGRSGNLEFQ